MKQKLFLLLFTVFSFTSGFSQAVAYDAPGIYQCGNEVFDLTQQTPIILGNQDPQNFVVSYFETESDAENNTNAIEGSTQYVGEQYQIIYARVTNPEDNTYAINSFGIGWGNEVFVNQPTDMVVCDYDGNGVAVVDLTVKVDEILNGDSEMIITFHETSDDAWFSVNGQEGANPILNPENYTNIINLGNPYTIYVRVSRQASVCFTVVAFEVFIEDCTVETENIVSGVITHDTESNNCESGSTPAAYVTVKITNQNSVRYTFTDAAGNYTFYNVPDGNNYITVMDQGAITYVASPASYTVTTPGVFEGNNFCLGEPGPVTDVAVFISPQLQPRPGFPMSYTIVLQNLGNTTENGMVNFTFDDSILNYINSTPAMIVSGNTLTFAYTNLEPYQWLYIHVNFTTEVTAAIGTPLAITATVNLPAADIDPANNEHVLNQVVVGSYDPNDISCREGELITEAQADGYLHYTIRFQNTAEGEGAAEAIFVVVDQDLDADLDPSTFQPIGASHDYVVRLEDGHLNVRYDDINLPPVGLDEQGSNGYFMYRIKPRSNVQLGDSFEAQASIVFDFNDPIVTNNYITTIEGITGSEENTANAFVIYPNPASHVINFQVNDIAAGKANVVIADVLGKTVMSSTIQLNGNTATLDVSSLNSGMYFVTLEAEGKQVTKKLVIE